MTRLNLPYLFILIILTNWGCSSNDPEPQIDEDPFGFGLFTEENLIDGVNFVSYPEEMATVEDNCAFTATTMVSFANTFTFYRSYFFPFFATETRTDPIISLNGHSNYQIREWSPDGGLSSLAIQFSETSNLRHQLIFIKEDGGPYERFIESSENKDRTEGDMKIYDSDDLNEVVVTFDWVLLSNGTREIVVTEPENDDFYLKVTNETDLSGSVDYSEIGNNRKVIVWDANGNGSWQEFDEGGNLVDEGSWTVE